jgi:hypothetical protein
MLNHAGSKKRKNTKRTDWGWHMARICIVTQDLSVGGGVLTKLAAFLRFAASRNHICDLYFPTTGKYPAT